MTAIDAEKAVLGALMMEQNHLARVISSGITIDSFTDERNRQIFEALNNASKEGKKLDLISLKTMFPKLAGYLLELSESFATTAHLDSWTVAIRQSQACRMLKAAANGVLNIKPHETEESLSQLQIELANIQRLLTSTKARSCNEILQSCFSQMQNATKFVIPYFSESDPAASMIRHSKREMHVIAAGSGIGKTALAVGAELEQLKAGHVIAYFCFESDSEAIMARLAAAISGVSHYKALYGTLNAADMLKFKNGADFIRKNSQNLFIRGVETGIMTVEGVRSETQNIIAERGKIDVIVIDFLQAMSVSGNQRRLDRHLQIANIVSELHKLFIETNTAGIVLAQLTKDGAKAGQLPGLEHIKDSSVIVQLAHIVSFLSRDQKNNKDFEPVLWYSRKTRNQMPFKTELLFDGTKYTGKARYNSQDDPM